jgi:hypothetical protein
MGRYSSAVSSRKGRRWTIDDDLSNLIPDLGHSVTISLGRDPDGDPYDEVVVAKKKVGGRVVGEAIGESYEEALAFLSKLFGSNKSRRY